RMTMRFSPAMDANSGELYLPVEERGRGLLEEPLLNKGTAFTPEERDALGLRGLLPAHTSTMDEQLARVRTQWDGKPNALEQHIYLEGLHDRNETLYHRFVLENLQDAVPVVYTPTVAEACRYWSRLHRQARGIYITPADRGQIARVLRCRGIRDAAVVVVTDNERILGIGDQGAGGMGIPIGKLALYTVGAGIHPSLCLPVSLDVGTNNEDLLRDPLYLGWREPRLRGDPYWSLVDEFVMAVKEVFPQALLQWEDFANITSFRLMDTYREVVTSFNDDIEGTAAMVVGGLLAGLRRLGGRLSDRTIAIFGGGSAGTGIYRQIASEMQREGLSREEATARLFVIDLPGLLVEGDEGLDPRMAELATRREVVAAWHVAGDRIGLEQVIEHARPSVLIGVCGRPGQFTEAAVRAMAAQTESPIIMPMSNPTANAEGVPADLIAWTGGRALVATGSPFGDVVHDGRRHRVGQANNVFVFPGVGLGVIAARARKVTATMFGAAAHALAASVDDEMLAQGSLYPPISEVREVSRRVAHAVALQAISEGVADPAVDVEALIAQAMWYPAYLPYRPA
ncbi:MAG: NAD-dependent malic enzyme, partial [Acidobacteria bacterium]|nr:NAD-dependent malic enzyme [Acidobacteriota bacterium]